MANKKIQPKLYDLEIIIPNGENLITKSTWSKGSLRVENSFRDHPAWTGEGRNAINTSSERVERANKRYGDISFNLDDLDK